MTRVIIKGEVELGQLCLFGDEHHYLSRVRRSSGNQVVEVRDSRGFVYLGRIVSIEPNQTLIEIFERSTARGVVWPVCLWMAVPKRNLFDDVVRMVSQIGVEKIVPLLAERSVVRPGSGKVDRWRKIAEESVRQCGRPAPLEVEAPISFSDAVARVNSYGTKLILHPYANGNGSSIGGERDDDQRNDMIVAIGPEGGFAESEVKMAQDAGFIGLNLGDNVLKVETAAVVASVLAVAKLGGFAQFV